MITHTATKKYLKGLLNICKQFNNNIRLRSAGPTILLMASVLIFSAAVAQTNYRPCLVIDKFAISGITTTDYSNGLQQAIDSAAITGSCVCIPAGTYHFTKTIHLPAGVSLLGAGMGANANQKPVNGTILSYSGTGTAIEITGTNSGIKDLTIYNPHGTAANGVVLLSDSNLVESVVLSGVLIFGFTGGTALQLEARHHGGLGYGSFYDCRVRHANIGIHIIEKGEGAFVNSNTFFHGAVSGGGFDNCLLVDGGDNNVFYNTVIEPYSSKHGHLVVNKGQIIGENIRIEATKQDPTLPVIYFGPASALSKINGFFSGGVVINKGNNSIDFTTPDYTGESNPGYNQLVNAAFLLPGNNGVPAYWTASSAKIILNTVAEEVIQGEKVILAIVPPGIVCDFYPAAGYAPSTATYPLYHYANFSALVKTNVQGVVKLTYNYAGGLVSSTAHTGSSEWEALGLQIITNPAHAPQPKIHIDNASGKDSLRVAITSPAFNFGNKTPQRDAGIITSAGGIITGTLTTSVTKKYVFTRKTGYLQLPKNGNVFMLDGADLSIGRINNRDADRFPPGTVITLLFNQAGSRVLKSSFINLKNDFTAAAANTSLTMMVEDNGNWRELNRNN